MNGGAGPATVRRVETSSVLRIADIEPSAWDALVGADDPFVEHAFLHALEESGSVGGKSGWQPRHVVVRKGGVLRAALPLYEKDDSWGEFIFDFQWARAAQQLGLAYYPKLVAMVPFTPATGRRLLVAEGDPERAALVRALAEGARIEAAAARASSLHVLGHEEDVERRGSSWPRCGRASPSSSTGATRAGRASRSTSRRFAPRRASRCGASAARWPRAGSTSS